MIPRDKFGNPIYPHKYKILLEQGKILEKAGYRESKGKSNLFFTNTVECVFFADMRGTEIVPIWENTDPLIYWKLIPEIASWKRIRLLNEEFTHFSSLKLPYRLSPEYHGQDLGSNVMIVSDENGVKIYGEDGYCKYCNYDFRENGEYCSDECKSKYEEEIRKKQCRVCRKKCYTENLVSHHISYYPEKTISVCRACHLKIHTTDSYPRLTPSKIDTDKFYKRDDDSLREKVKIAEERRKRKEQKEKDKILKREMDIKLYSLAKHSFPLNPKLVSHKTCLKCGAKLKSFNGVHGGWFWKCPNGCR